MNRIYLFKEEMAYSQSNWMYKVIIDESNEPVPNVIEIVKSIFNYESHARPVRR